MYGSGISKPWVLRSQDSQGLDTCVSIERWRCFWVSMLHFSQGYALVEKTIYHWNMGCLMVVYTKIVPYIYIYIKYHMTVGCISCPSFQDSKGIESRFTPTVFNLWFPLLFWRAPHTTYSHQSNRLKEKKDFRSHENLEIWHQLNGGSWFP